MPVLSLCYRFGIVGEDRLEDAFHEERHASTADTAESPLPGNWHGGFGKPLRNLPGSNSGTTPQAISTRCRALVATTFTPG
jgi:hypothetical protein